MNFSQTNFSQTSVGTLGRSIWGARFFLLCIFLIIALPPVLRTDHGNGGLAIDAVLFHLPQINFFLKSPYSFVDYPATATTLPFYHALFGGVARLFQLSEVTNDVLSIRLFHFLLSFVGIGFFLYLLTKNTSPLTSCALGLPFVTSWYVISGAVYLGTDGPSLSIALIGLCCAVELPTSALASGLSMLGLAAVRHICLPYAAGLHATNALYSGDRKHMFLFAIFAIPAAALLLFYIRHWGGLTPPGMVAQLNRAGFFLHSLLGQLVIAGIFGAAFGFTRVHVWKRLITRRHTQITLVFLAAVLSVFWVITQTNYSPEDGRVGSLAWTVATVMVGKRSLIVLLLSIVGMSVILLYLLDMLEHKLRPVEIIGLCFFLLGLAITFAAYQRYSEPLCVASFAMATSRLNGNIKLHPWQLVPVVLVSLAGLGKLYFAFLH